MEDTSMIIEKINGTLVVSAIINGYLEKQMYIGFSKREAISNFKKRYNLK